MEIIDSKENLIRLIEQYQNLVFSICLKLTGDYFTAEDITQDTFISAFNHWENFDKANEKAWICRIATNKCIDYKRAAARKVTALDDEIVENMVDMREPLSEILNKEVMDNFYKAIDRLDEPYRSVARKHFVNGKTAKEIADESGNGLKTIQTQILRAKNQLKSTIRREELIT